MVTEIKKVLHLLNKVWRKVSFSFLGTLWLSIPLDQSYSKSVLWTSKMSIPGNFLGSISSPSIPAGLEMQG